ncbi:RCC1 and BTB domain-containing protein 1 [Folsomia candida]|nr:RCC1 and BTB domain-containing protein 1 [Folsomia candida]
MQPLPVSGNPTTVVEELSFSGYKSVKEVATCVTEDVSVVELNANTCLGRYVGNRAPWTVPFFTKSASLDEAFAQISQTSYRTMWVAREPEPRKLCDDISNLWTTKKNADVTFSVEGKLISAHKLILTMRSEYFEKMFSGEWAETDGSIVDIKDTNHDIFEGLIFYIYHDKIPFANFDYENLFGLMKLADSYCDLTIRRECEEILMGSVNKENAFFLLRNAASVNALDLEEKVTKVILDSQFFGETLSPAELVDLLGREAFDKLATAAFYRN